MRNNQPVTQQETIIPDGVFIYSRTDLKGQITEANRAFADISGYTQDEMVGQPHNMIRHPDMPKEAFADMWRSLKAGRPWQGVVKNRRKDGGFYWVIANVSPVRENGQIVGYQSLRNRPARAQIVDNQFQVGGRASLGDELIDFLQLEAKRAGGAFVFLRRIALQLVNKLVEGAGYCRLGIAG